MRKLIHAVMVKIINPLTGHRIWGKGKEPKMLE
jgi:hypothetical protein